MLDIGAGGGFPGIPLKILRPSLSVTLVDASRKKVSFLKHLIRILKLENAQARHIRAEGLADDRNLVGVFDIVICRAFSDLPTFASMAMPFIDRNGVMIALKGKVGEEEIAATRGLTRPGGTRSDGNGMNVSVDVKRYQLPYLKAERSIISLRVKPKS